MRRRPIANVVTRKYVSLSRGNRRGRLLELVATMCAGPNDQEHATSTQNTRGKRRDGCTHATMHLSGDAV